MFIEQAFKGNNSPIRVWMTALLTGGIFIGNVIVYFTSSKEDMKAIYDAMKGIPNNLALVLNLMPFVFLLGLLFLLVRYLHERSILSLTTSRPKVDFGRVFTSFGLIVFFSIVTFVISYFYDHSNIVWNFQPIPFLILLLLSILLLPIQIGFEEYLFRGFLMQQIGIATKNRWMPLAVTSIIFGLFHSANPEVTEMGFGVMVFYIGTGLLLGVFTLMDEGMELALGFHFGNNLITALLMTSEFSALHTDALFKYTGQENPSAVLNEMLLTMAVMYPLLLVILFKKYGWSNWKEKLTGNVTETPFLKEDNK